MGRTDDRDTPISFEQDAADVVALLKNLNIEKVDFFGFSNGGNTTMLIAIQHPEISRIKLLWRHHFLKGVVCIHNSGT